MKTSRHGLQIRIQSTWSPAQHDVTIPVSMELEMEMETGQATGRASIDSEAPDNLVCSLFHNGTVLRYLGI